MAFTISGSLAIDETSGAQQGSSGSNAFSDNDVSIATFSAVGGAPEFDLFLSTLLLPTPTGASVSNATSANPTGTALLTGFGANVTDLAFTDANGDPLDGDLAKFGPGATDFLMTADGFKIYLYSYTGADIPGIDENNVVLGRKANADGSANPTGAIVFAAYLQPTDASGNVQSSDAGAVGAKVWLVEYLPLDHGVDGSTAADFDDSRILFDPLYVSVSNRIDFSLEGAPSGQNLFLMWGDGTPAAGEVAIITTGKEPINQSDDPSAITAGDTVNTSQGGGPTTLGSNNQMIDPGEGLYFSFVTTTAAGEGVTVPNLDQNEADVEGNITFSSYFGATEAIFSVVQLQPPKASTLLLSAFNNTGAGEVGNAYIDGLGDADDLPVNITAVSITRTFKDGSTATYDFASDTGVLSNGGLTLDFAGTTVKITGVVAGDVIDYTTASLHNRLLIDNAGSSDAKFNASFDIGAFSLVTSSRVPQAFQALSFQDDGPSAAGTAQAGTADEDGGLAGGNPGGPGDDATASSVATGSVVAIFDGGADGVGSYGLSTDTSGLPQTLTSKGAAVLYDVTGNLLTAYAEEGGGAGYQAADDREVFSFSLDATTGAYTFTLLDQLDHSVEDDPGTVAVETAFEDEITIQLGSILRVFDKDGDFATATSEKLVITVDDDSPLANGTAVSDAVDEDGLPGGNPGGTGDLVVPNDDGDNNEATTNGSIASIFSVGADEPATYGLSSDTSGLTALNSKGQAVSYAVSGNTLTAFVNLGGGAGYDAGTDRAVFTFALTNTTTGAYTFTLLDQLDHLNGNDENERSIELGSILQATDKDGDMVTATAEKLVITVDDDSPVVTLKSNLVYANAANPTPGGTGLFDYNIGADERLGTTYSASNSDLIVALTGVSVGSDFITNKSVTWVSEDDNQAVFDVAFTYVSNPISGATTNATGSLSFDKVGGTYSLSLDAPVTSFSVLTTGTAQGFTGYLPGTQTEDNSQPEVTVAKLASNFFVQFSGFQEKAGGTGDNNLKAVGEDSDGNNFEDGELFTQSSTWVSVSGEAAGVAGDTMQQGEVLDFDFFTSNPFGDTSLDPTATSSAIFIEFDALDNNEDLVVVLKLVDANNPSITTTRAVIADFGDIFHKAQAGSIPPVFGFTGSLDNNDGLVIIESQDYNAAGENWVIQGAQVLASTEGVTGTGINLDGGLGAGNGWDGSTQTFGDSEDVHNTLTATEAGTWDGDVFKIVNIGFVTAVTPDAHLSFDVSVVDNDGDATAVQTLDVSIVGGDGMTATAGPDTFVFGDPDADGLLSAAMYNITGGFASGIDKLDLAAAGSGTNYVENLTPAASVAAFISAADAALNGTVDYYFGVVGGNGYLATDADGLGITSIIELVGVTDMALGDII